MGCADQPVDGVVLVRPLGTVASSLSKQAVTVVFIAIVDTGHIGVVLAGQLACGVVIPATGAAIGVGD